MKFDSLVSKILNEENHIKRTYIVKFSRKAKDVYGLKDGTTDAFSKAQAATLVISRQIKDKDKALVIWKVRNWGIEVKPYIYPKQGEIKSVQSKKENEQLSLDLNNFKSL